MRSYITLTGLLSYTIALIRVFGGKSFQIKIIYLLLFANNYVPRLKKIVKTVFQETKFKRTREIY